LAADAAVFVKERWQCLQAIAPVLTGSAQNGHSKKTGEGIGVVLRALPQYKPTTKPINTPTRRNPIATPRAPEIVRLASSLVKGVA
jgi:hypothetical protein